MTHSSYKALLQSDEDSPRPNIRQDSHTSWPADLILAHFRICLAASERNNNPDAFLDRYCNEEPT